MSDPQPKLLDFENPKYQKGYKWLPLNKKSIKANIGKSICLARCTDNYRAYVQVKYIVIHSMRYSTIYFNDGHDSTDIRNWSEAGIKIE